MYVSLISPSACNLNLLEFSQREGLKQKKKMGKIRWEVRIKNRKNKKCPNLYEATPVLDPSMYMNQSSYFYIQTFRHWIVLSWHIELRGYNYCGAAGAYDCLTNRSCRGVKWQQLPAWGQSRAEGVGWRRGRRASRALCNVLVQGNHLDRAAVQFISVPCCAINNFYTCIVCFM